MKLKDKSRGQRQLRTPVGELLRNHKLLRTLDGYERFIRWKSSKYARVYEDQKDFQQIGREAVMRVFERINGGLEVEKEQGYYVTSVDHAMLDYALKLYRKTHFVWHYDKKNAPTRTKRFRYRGEWKARIQYRGDALKLLTEQRKNVLSYDEIFGQRG